MQLIGKVLWWDQRDQNGVIRAPNGDEFYFDISVLDNRLKSKIRSGLVVTFEANTTVKDAVCAHKVRAANSREQTKLEKEISSRRQLSLFA